MKIRLTEDIDRSWHDLMKGRKFDVLDARPGKPGEQSHVWVRAQTGQLCHIYPGQYEVVDEPED